MRIRPPVLLLLVALSGALGAVGCGGESSASTNGHGHDRGYGSKPSY